MYPNQNPTKIDIECRKKKKHSCRVKVEELFIKKRQWNFVVFRAMIDGACYGQLELVMVSWCRRVFRRKWEGGSVCPDLCCVKHNPDIFFLLSCRECSTTYSSQLYNPQLVSIMVCWTSQSRGLWDNISCMSLVSLSPVLPHTPIKTSVQIFKKLKEHFDKTFMRYTTKVINMNKEVNKSYFDIKKQVVAKKNYIIPRTVKD